ncbi:MAG TPA: YkgJ family cysteine cluster protein [Methanocella sp.]|uniref:YkgJ family cysteine cluster protein n=1 Tax=Methanocella sp. TaxID=2052833 RepID=UPI002CA19D92|nr:YkgJ family cysteine cluster protein [Methanocella sp.]HTY91703.1 YkgJ family cysteine cluster protein [Methanocella sp.]
MASEELAQFFRANPQVYGHAGREDLDQLSRICELFPDSARLLSDAEAVELPMFECRRCGQCCSSVRYVTVCHADVKRWVAQKRLDILEGLVIDRRRTPLLAIRKDSIRAAKEEARALLAEAGLEDEHVFEILYVTKLLECAVYVKRAGGACALLREDGGMATCGIQDTKPLVCEKFPYYIGNYTDGRLLKEDSFCPSLSDIARKRT